MINTRTYKGGTNDLSYQHCLLQLLPFTQFFAATFFKGKNMGRKVEFVFSNALMIVDMYQKSVCLHCAIYSRSQMS